MPDQFNVIASLPRSGSTLLCNVLNQNPNFYASDTSPLSIGFANYLTSVVHRPEYTSELGNSQEEALSRLRGGARGLVLGYYAHRPESVIFDKDRSNSWLFQADALMNVLPESKIFCMVRDPREVVASAITHQSRLPLFREQGQPAARTLSHRVSTLIGPQGLVGAAISAVTDAILRSKTEAKAQDNIYLIKFEEFVADPQRSLDAIYQVLNLEPYTHDFQNVENKAKDQDFLYKNLWPHEGKGAIAPRRPTWPQVLPQAMAQSILRQYPLYCQTFGYN
jgi:sulfotransferase